MRVVGASSALASLVLFLGLAAPARAQKAVMEGVTTSNREFQVSTTTRRVNIATTSYNWAISNVGLHVASNVVVDALSAHNAIVLYATGTAVAKTFQGDGSGLTGIVGETNTYASSKTFSNATSGVLIVSSLTMSGAATGALDYSSVIVGAWSEVGEFSVNASTFLDVSGYDQRFMHRVSFSGYGDQTSWGLMLRLNGDTGTNYGWTSFYHAASVSSTPVSWASSVSTTSLTPIGAGGTFETFPQRSTATLTGTITTVRDTASGPYEVFTNFSGVCETGSGPSITNLCQFNVVGDYRSTSNPITLLTFLSVHGGATNPKLYGTLHFEAFVPKNTPSF